MATRRASCSCEQLRLIAEGDPIRVSICNCLACQRRTGSVFGVQARFDTAQIQTEGRYSEYVRSSDEGEARHFYFCPDCGGTVFYKSPSMPGMIAVPVGAFADPGFPRPIRSIYETRKHPWVQLPDDIEHETTQLSQRYEFPQASLDVGLRKRARPVPDRDSPTAPTPRRGARVRDPSHSAPVPVGELTDKLRSFLAERRYAVLATHDPDGGIHLTPIWFLFEDDRFYFASSSGSRKVKNVERTFSASVVVDAREPGRERWVSASGLVEILRDGEAQSINARIRRRYLAPKAFDGPIEAALAASDDVTLRLAPRAWRSWTAEIGESPERWFLAVHVQEARTVRVELVGDAAEHSRITNGPRIQASLSAAHGKRRKNGGYRWHRVRVGLAVALILIFAGVAIDSLLSASWALDDGLLLAAAAVIALALLLTRGRGRAKADAP